MEKEKLEALLIDYIDGNLTDAEVEALVERAVQESRARS